MKSDALRLVLPLLTLFLAAQAYSQDFLVTVQGDTIKGEIKPLSYGAERKVQVTEAGKKKVVYPFFKVKSYSVKGEMYQPVKGPDGYTFMKMIKPGYLSILAFQQENQTSFDGLWLLKRDGTGIEVPNITFEKGMKNFLEDCPALVKKIENDVLNKKDLHQIVDEYNECMVTPRPAAETPVAETPVASTPATPEKNLTAWDNLETKVKEQPDFPEKESALEMIGEIKTKISTSQKIPNFLIEGLKNSLQQDVFKPELEIALKEIN